MFHFFQNLESNIQYCALASKYVRIYRYANKLHFATWIVIYLTCPHIYGILEARCEL